MSEAATIDIPLWAEILTSFFALCGGLIGLLGASGVLRLPTFFARMHAPALITTAGIWCLMLATITYFSVQTGRPALYVLLLGFFIAVTAPITTIFLMRAALFRARQRGEDVPRSINMLQLATPKSAPDVDAEEAARREQGRRNKQAKQEAEAATAAAELKALEEHEGAIAAAQQTARQTAQQDDAPAESQPAASPATAPASPQAPAQQPDSSEPPAAR